jgi:hypothetical protein
LSAAPPVTDPPCTFVLDDVAGELYDILKLPEIDADAVLTLYCRVPHEERDAVTLDLIKEITGWYGGDAARAVEMLFVAIKDKDVFKDTYIRGLTDLEGNPVRWDGILQSPFYAADVPGRRHGP